MVEKTSAKLYGDRATLDDIVELARKAVKSAVIPDGSVRESNYESVSIKDTAVDDWRWKKNSYDRHVILEFENDNKKDGRHLGRDILLTSKKSYYIKHDSDECSTLTIKRKNQVEFTVLFYIK